MTEATPSSPDSKPPPTGALRLGLVVLAVILLAFFGLPRGCKLISDVAHRGKVVELFGGKEVLDIIQHPDRVTAQRVELLHSSEWTEKEYGEFHMANYRPMGVPVELSDSEIGRIGNLMTSGSSYLWGSAAEEMSSSSCAVLYGVHVDFVRNDRQVSVWLCFQCDLVVIAVDNEFDPTGAAFGYFDPIHDELAGIMRSLFPDDEAIQAL